MTMNPVITEAEDRVRLLAADLVAVRDGECLPCYVWRMLEYGCNGLRWAMHYRDSCAPRATALQQRLFRMGGFCDCEIFANAYVPIPPLWVFPDGAAGDGAAGDGAAGDEAAGDGAAGDEEAYGADPGWPEVMPPCTGVRRGSTRACTLWQRRRR